MIFLWKKLRDRNNNFSFLSDFQYVILWNRGYKTHKSLDAFSEKFSSRVGERYLVYTKDLRKDGETTLLPVYMTVLIWDCFGKEVEGFSGVIGFYLLFLQGWIILFMDKELATYHLESSSVVVYHSDDDAVQLEVQLSEETVWLTQKQMSWLFDTTSQNITIRINNVYKEHELEKGATCKVLTSSKYPRKFPLHWWHGLSHRRIVGRLWEEMVCFWTNGDWDWWFVAENVRLETLEMTKTDTGKRNMTITIEYKTHNYGNI